MKIQKIAITLLLMTVVIMMISGCTSQSVISTPTITATKTITITVTNTPTVSSDSFQQYEAISYIKMHLTELTGQTGDLLSSNYQALDVQFNWSAHLSQNSNSIYLVSASYVLGSPAANIGTWQIDLANHNISPVDSNAQKTEAAVILHKTTTILPVP
jgi:ribosomal protein S10